MFVAYSCRGTGDVDVVDGGPRGWLVEIGVVINPVIEQDKHKIQSLSLKLGYLIELHLYLMHFFDNPKFHQS